MFTYSAVLVNDEQAAHYAMQLLLKQHNRINIIGQAYNGLHAIELINSMRPNIVFLDI